MSSESTSGTSIKEQQSDLTEARKTNHSVDYGKAVGKIAAMMAKEGALSTGDMAELRRISPDEPFTPALWRILLMRDLDEAPDRYNQGTWERRWATLLMGMAHCRGLHDYTISLGQALVKAGWSELRFVQLMRSNGETLEKHLRRVARFLSSKHQSANWTDVAWLLFAQSGDTAENVRLNISRDYYSALYALENN